MSNRHNAIGVKNNYSGEVEAHASADPGGAGYGTLCGLSLNDDEFSVAPIADNAKITCPACQQVWKEALRFKVSDFSKGQP